MFKALDDLMAASLPQMELYCKIGQLVSGRPEKGAAVAAAEYLCGAYPEVAGFSPRNLRRMRKFYCTYESDPELLHKAMTIGWTQNVVILEVDLTLQERKWYIQAVQQHSWSKLELQSKIESGAHLKISLDLAGEVCYTEKVNPIKEQLGHDRNSFYVPRQCSSQSNGQVYRERSGEERETGELIPHRTRRCQCQEDWELSLLGRPMQADQAWEQLCERNYAIARQYILRPPDRDGSDQPVEYEPHLWRRLQGKDTSVDG